MAGNKLKELLDLAHSETYGRFKDIIITSVIGIVVNVLLGVIKIIVGTVANSVAVIPAQAGQEVEVWRFMWMRLQF